MNSIECGKFIAELRKEKRLTQNELAEKLQITNKAVSRWETGEGFPDVSILPALADILDVSVDEILRGKRKSNQDLRPDKRLKLTFSNHLLIIKGLLILGYFLFLALSYTTFKVWIGGIVYVSIGIAAYLWFFIARNRYIALSEYNEGDRLILFTEERNVVTTTATLSAMVFVMIILVGLIGMYVNGVVTFYDYVVWASISGMTAFLLANGYYAIQGKRLGVEKPIDWMKSLGVVYAFLLVMPLSGNLRVLGIGTILYYLPILMFAVSTFFILRKEGIKRHLALAILDVLSLMLMVLFVERVEDFAYIVLSLLFIIVLLLALWHSIRGVVRHQRNGSFVISIRLLIIVLFYILISGSATRGVDGEVEWIQQTTLFFYYLLLPLSLFLTKPNRIDGTPKPKKSKTDVDDLSISSQTEGNE
jgi:transcriptional regulator with XRE-family HTH domain